MADRSIPVEGQALLKKVRQSSRFANKAEADCCFGSLPLMPYGTGEEPSLRRTDEEKMKLADSAED